MPKVSQTVLISAERSQLGYHHALQLARIVRREVAQAPVLEPAPDRLYRVQHRRVRRQPFQVQPIGETPQQLTDRVALVHRAAVPQNHQPPRYPTQHHAEEVRRALVIEISIRQRLEDQPQAILCGRQTQGCRHRDPLPMFPLLQQDRGLAAGRPSTADQRCHQQAAFIGKDQAGSLPTRLFLIRGQSVASQSAMASGFRSRGTRWGLCGVRPCARIQRCRYRGCKPMPSSLSIRLPLDQGGDPRPRPKFCPKAVLGRRIGQPAKNDFLLGTAQLAWASRNGPGRQAGDALPAEGRPPAPYAARIDIQETRDLCHRIPFQETIDGEVPAVFQDLGGAVASHAGKHTAPKRERALLL